MLTGLFMLLATKRKPDIDGRLEPSCSSHDALRLTYATGPRSSVAAVAVYVADEGVWSASPRDLSLSGMLSGMFNQFLDGVK